MFEYMLFGITYLHWLIILGAGISLAGGSLYIRDTLRGDTKPNRVSWFLWMLAPFIGTGAAISAGADAWVTVPVFMAGFIPLLVLVASFVNKQSYWKLELFDGICGGLSLVALVLWLVVDLPVLAVVLAATGDGFAALPTLRKSWRHPDTETGITYAVAIVAMLLVFPSITVWNLESVVFPMYLLAVNGSLVFALYRKRLFDFVARLKVKV